MQLSSPKIPRINRHKKRREVDVYCLENETNNKAEERTQNTKKKEKEKEKEKERFNKMICYQTFQITAIRQISFGIGNINISSSNSSI
jgi:hypothetical protein